MSRRATFDISDRKLAQLERERAVDLLTTTLRSIGDAVIATDPEGRVSFMNIVAERLTKWTSDEARGQLLHEVFPIFNEETGASAAALEVATHFHPDIAILDIGLPEMDGYQLAAAMRERLGPRVRLMALTGYGQDRDISRAEAAGFEAHFVKPVALAKLLTEIEMGRVVVS